MLEYIYYKKNIIFVQKLKQNLKPEGACKNILIIFNILISFLFNNSCYRTKNFVANTEFQFKKN